MRRTKHDAERTKQAILDAAETLFLKNGVSRTSLEMIAKECGVTRGAVYWHFTDKAQLVQEMLDCIRIPLDEFTEELSNDQEGDSLLKLYERCVECMEKFLEPGRERRMMTILMHRCEFTQDLHRVEQRGNTLTLEFVTLVERLFDSQRQRLQAGVTPRGASLQLHSLFTGTLACILRDEDTYAPHIDARRVFTLYFRSLVKEWP